jgi:sugar O-acyltransferase (sialic acid O-acetyltransferase NeuD family)
MKSRKFVNTYVTSRLQADSSVIVVGAGAHARSILGVLADIGCHIEGLVADGSEPGTLFAGAELLGGLADVSDLCKNLPEVSWVMAIGDNYHRLRIMREMKAACPGAIFPPLVHPSCVIATDVVLESGAVVMPGAVIMAACHLGECSLVNTRSSLDHESSLGAGASLAPGVITAGRVTIGSRSFVAIGSTVSQGISVGDDSVIGAGSLLLQDVPDHSVAYGRPAKIIRKRDADESYF